MLCIVGLQQKDARLRAGVCETASCKCHLDLLKGMKAVLVMHPGKNKRRFVICHVLSAAGVAQGGSHSIQNGSYQLLMLPTVSGMLAQQKNCLCLHCRTAAG